MLTFLLIFCLLFAHYHLTLKTLTKTVRLADAENHTWKANLKWIG